jgi:hypothetical protein
MIMKLAYLMIKPLMCLLNLEHAPVDSLHFFGNPADLGVTGLNCGMKLASLNH